MTEIPDSSLINNEAFAKWIVLRSNHSKYVAFVDGDLVEEGDDYPRVSINASELASQRGEGAKLSIFDSTDYGR